MGLSHERPEAGSLIAWHICAMSLESGGPPGREMTRAGASASARLAHIASAVRAHAPALAERDGTYIEAAVALILRETRDDDLELLFIKRAPARRRSLERPDRFSRRAARRDRCVARGHGGPGDARRSRARAAPRWHDHRRARRAAAAHPRPAARDRPAARGPGLDGRDYSVRATKSPSTSGRRSTPFSIRRRRATRRSSCGRCVPCGRRFTSEGT